MDTDPGLVTEPSSGEPRRPAKSKRMRIPGEASSFGEGPWWARFVALLVSKPEGLCFLVSSALAFAFIAHLLGFIPGLGRFETAPVTAVGGGFTWDVGAVKLSCKPQADDKLACVPKTDADDLAQPAGDK